MYKFIIHPVTNKKVEINSLSGKNIIYNYINQLNLQSGGGPLVKISEKMLHTLSFPSTELCETGMDCGAISLYFLGVFDNTLIKVLSFIKKNPSIGILTDYLLQLIREYENKIRKNNPEFIINDLGPSQLMYKSHPKNMRSKKSKLKWYKRMINNIYHNIPNGFGTILYYQRFDFSGHFLIIIKGIHGTKNLLDIQQDHIIQGIDDVSQYCLKEDIHTFGIFYNGLQLNSVENPITKISGHTIKRIPRREVEELVRNISY